MQDVGKDGGDHTVRRPLSGPPRTRSDHRLPRRRFARGATGLGPLKAHSSLIVNRQAEDDLTPLPGWVPSAKTISDDGRVAEERILHPALTTLP